MVTKNILKKCHALQQFGKIPADLTKLKPLPNRFSKQTYFVFFLLISFIIWHLLTKNANQLQISAKGGILFIIVIVYHVTKPRGNRVKLPLP